MKVAVLLSLLMCWVGFGEARMFSPTLRETSIPKENILSYEKHEYLQALDHSDRTYSPLFRQVYFTNFDFVPADRSVQTLFVYTCGEASIEHYWNQSTYVHDLARSFQAGILYIEHRFYGSSMPYGPKAYEPKTIAHLTVDNAIQDFLRVIQWVGKDFLAPKIVAFGGSYAGMIASYMSTAYPKTITAVVASSAPVLMAGQGYPNPHTADEDYFKVVTKDYELSNTRCPDLVRAGYVYLRDLAQKKDYSTITSIFNLCQPIQSAADVEYLELYIRQGFLTMAQINYPYARDFGANKDFPANPVQTSCQVMLDVVDNATCQSQHTFLKAIAAGVNVYYDAATTDSCFDMRKLFIFCADQTGCGDGDDSRSWDYQVCREMNYFPTTNGQTDMFPPRGYTLEDHTKYCTKTWGVLPNPKAMLHKFSKEHLRNAKNVMWTQGTWDPWYYGGFFESVPWQGNEIADGAAHHEDLNGVHPNDSQQVKHLRIEILKFLSEILQK